MARSPCHRLRQPWSPVALIVVTSFPIAAQDETSGKSGEVVGVVADALTGAPLGGAFVSIVKSDWGLFTNHDGQFRLDEIAIGPHAIAIGHLGYKPIETVVDATTRSGDPVTLFMQPDPILLEGLEIVTDRFRDRSRGAATPVQTFHHDVLSTSTHGSLRDFLNVQAMTRLPPCGGRYSRRGQWAASLVYFDEVRLLDGCTYLDTFAPHDFYIVEVYGRGRHIRAYSRVFMEQAAQSRLFPLPLPR